MAIFVARIRYVFLEYQIDIGPSLVSTFAYSSLKSVRLPKYLFCRIAACCALYSRQGQAVWNGEVGLIGWQWVQPVPYGVQLHLYQKLMVS